MRVLLTTSLATAILAHAVFAAPIDRNPPNSVNLERSLKGLTQAERDWIEADLALARRSYALAADAEDDLRDAKYIQARDTAVSDVLGRTSDNPESKDGEAEALLNHLYKRQPDEKANAFDFTPGPAQGHRNEAEFITPFSGHFQSLELSEYKKRDPSPANVFKSLKAQDELEKRDVRAESSTPDAIDQQFGYIRGHLEDLEKTALKPRMVEDYPDHDLEARDFELDEAGLPVGFDYEANGLVRRAVPESAEVDHFADFEQWSESGSRLEARRERADGEWPDWPGFGDDSNIPHRRDLSSDLADGEWPKLRITPDQPPHISGLESRDESSPASIGKWLSRDSNLAKRGETGGEDCCEPENETNKYKWDDHGKYDGNGNPLADDKHHVRSLGLEDHENSLTARDEAVNSDYSWYHYPKTGDDDGDGANVPRSLKNEDAIESVDEYSERLTGHHSVANGETFEGYSWLHDPKVFNDESANVPRSLKHEESINSLHNDPQHPRQKQSQHSRQHTREQTKLYNNLATRSVSELTAEEADALSEEFFNSPSFLENRALHEVISDTADSPDDIHRWNNHHTRDKKQPPRSLSNQEADGLSEDDIKMSNNNLVARSVSELSATEADALSEEFFHSPSNLEARALNEVDSKENLSEDEIELYNEFSARSLNDEEDEDENELYNELGARSLNNDDDEEEEADETELYNAIGARSLIYDHEEDDSSVADFERISHRLDARSLPRNCGSTAGSHC